LEIFAMRQVLSPLPIVGRVLIAAIFVMSGAGKIADPAGTIGYIRSAGLPLPEAAYALSAVVELLGGLLLVAGYQTRLVALMLAGFTFAAALAFHAHFDDANQTIHFMKNLAMAGGLLQITAFGAGAFSLDAWRAQSQARTARTVHA
jgi:putative oxidoreductase